MPPLAIEIILFALAATVGYLLGSLNFAVIWSKLIYHDDIRNHGSGNAGTTNMLRTYGKKAAVLTLLGDLLKGVIAALAFGLFFKFVGEGQNIGLLTYVKGATVAGLFAIFGHNWPVFFNFKGGKGVLSSFAVILTVIPIQGLICLAVFIIVVLITKYVSLGSVLGAAALPVVTIISVLREGFKADPDGIFLLIFAAISSILVIIRHRENIKRIFKGTENKLSFGKKTEK